MIIIVSNYNETIRNQVYCIFVRVTRYAGTIIGNEVIDIIRWPGSEWRCLKVIRPFPSLLDLVLRSYNTFMFYITRFN